MTDDAAVQEALARILASDGFVNAPRMSRFLRFVAEETAAGRAAALKEYVVALRVFDKAESFDPTVDPTVRVEASKLRAKLARYYDTEGRDDPLIIEIPKGRYGARFQARAGSVQSGRPAEEADPTAIESRAVRRPAFARHRTALVLGAVTLVAAGIYTAWTFTRERSIAPSGRVMLAVLPLQNLTGDPEQDYLCDGLTEEMIAHLSSADPARLGVIARTSAMHYKRTTKRADEIGRELGVGYLLEASFRRFGDRVRVTAQLIDARSQGHVWVEQYERDAGDLLALQSEVAAAVTRRTAMSLGFAPRSVNASMERVPGNSLAYEQYLRGRVYWMKDTADGLQRSLVHFQKAIAIDPAYARAYSGLADSYMLLGSYGLMPMAESHPLGRQAALKALQLDDSLADAHRSLAAILADHYWAWDEVEEHYKRAMELAPADVTTLRFYSFYLAYTGRPLEALPIARRACSLDPVSVHARLNLGVVLHIARRDDEALRELEETLDLDRTFGFGYAMLGMAYASKGMPGRAVEELERALAAAPTRPDIVALHGYTLARAGRRREALATLDEVRRLTKPSDPPPFQMAVVYVGLEDWPRAFDWLDKALAARAWEMPLLKASPMFDPLRSDGRYPALIAGVGLPNP